MALAGVEVKHVEAVPEENCSAKPTKQGEGLRHYYSLNIHEHQLLLRQKTHNLNRLEAQRNELNSRVRMLREELQLLQEPGSYVGEVVKVMGKNKVLVKVHPEGKYVVDIDKSIDITKITPSTRVALRNDSYVLHLVLPSKVDPLVNLMKVEKVPDSTYDMIGGLDQQIKEIKEVIELPIKHPELFESLGIAQPKGVLLYGPPGTGKTLLARAVAHHTDCTFIRVSGSELVQKYIGEGSRMVRELFVMAREHAPSIIFMDEIDSIGSARMESGSGNGDSEVQRTMLELLNQLDGFEASNKIKKDHSEMSSSVPQVSNKKTMWLHPKVLGFNPSERWGHSACFSKGLMYVFGGCCGGLHFCDVLTLDLNKMVWSKLTTTGEKPGPRDSHSAVLVGHKMIVFGGTNGFKKVNHIHILDLVTKEWFRPECKGTPPSPRESHTATLVGDERIVIFGGSGEGHANYLNDLHILDLRTMNWTSPELKGDLPVPRDSHSTLAIGNKLIVYGGDSGDQYHGNVHMLDMATMTWSRLTIQGSPPGVRAGHAAVNIGTKVYIIGGVGDKRYYNDVWIFDICNFSWTQLDIHFQQPQGRFSHTAVAAGMDIAIYGGCGEDERPLNELLVLQLAAEHPNGRYYVPMCKPIGAYWNQEKNIIPAEADTKSKTILVRNNVEAFGNGAHEIASEKSSPYHFDSGTSRQKRRRIAAAKVWDVESEQEDSFLSLSLHSSPYQSDQEQTPSQEANTLFPTTSQHENVSNYKRTLKNIPLKTPQALHFLQHKLKQEQCFHVNEDRKRAQRQAAEQKPMMRPIQHLIGAEVGERVEGSYDSVSLSPAAVNGRIFRGVIFAPGAGVVSKGASVKPNCPLTASLPSSQAFLRTSQEAPICLHAEPYHGSRSRQTPVALPFPIMGATPSVVSKEHKIRSDLQGLALTLGGPASGNPQVKH